MAHGDSSGGEAERDGSQEEQRRTGRRPGHELAQARERRGIDLAKMAARLHLPERQVEALERDDYQQLPPPAFVRGYLRAYAREVGLVGDDIVGAYDALGPEADDPEIRPVEGKEGGGSARATVASLVILIGVVGAAFGGWLWRSQQAVDEPSATVSSEQTVSEDDGTAEPAGQTDEVTGSGSEPSNQGSDTQDGAAADKADAGEVTETGDTAAGDAAETTPGQQSGDTEASTSGQATPETGGGDSPSADEQQAREQDEALASAAESAAGGDEAAATDEGGAEGDADGGASEGEYDHPNATSSAERATAPAAEEGPATVELEFAGRSWIEVYDARGRQLVYTLYLGDEPLRLRGWAPFDVFLGNSPAVRVWFEGDAVTKSAFTRSDQTARFLVDEDGARRR